MIDYARRSCRVLFYGILLSMFMSSYGQADHWGLTYGREYGSNTAANVPTQAQLFSTGPGGFFVGAGLTEDTYSESPYVGFTSPGISTVNPGNLNFLFIAPTNPYRFHVFDPLLSSDHTVDCWWLAPLIRRYLFEFHWRRTASNETVTFFPYNPAYHYDKNSDFNTQTADSTFFNSDRNSPVPASIWHAQVFVVPQGMNRLIEAKAKVSSTSGDPLRFRISIVQMAGSSGNRPTGPQLGPALLSREITSGRFNDVMVAWNLDDIKVTSGQRYGLRVESADRQPVVVNGTEDNYYTSGHFYSYANNRDGWIEYIDRDLVSVVVGASRPNATPQPTPTPLPGSGPVTVIGANLLVNSSFEQSSGTTHPGWTNNTDFGTSGRFPDPIAALDGDQWASYSYGNGGQSVREIYQTVDVIPGAEYGLSALHFSGGQDGTVQVFLAWNDGPYPGKNNSITVDSDRWSGGSSVPWTRLSGNVSPVTNKLTFVMRVVINGWGSGANLDQCTVTLLSMPSTPSATSTPSPILTPTPTPVVPTATPVAVDAMRCDFNKDGIVDQLDLLIFAAHWHETSYGSQ